MTIALVPGGRTPPLRGDPLIPLITVPVRYGRVGIHISPNFIIQITYQILQLVGAGSSRPFFNKFKSLFVYGGDGVIPSSLLLPLPYVTGRRAGGPRPYGVIIAFQLLGIAFVHPIS